MIQASILNKVRLSAFFITILIGMNCVGSSTEESNSISDQKTVIDCNPWLYMPEARLYELDGVVDLKVETDSQGGLDATIVKGSGWKILDAIALANVVSCRDVSKIASMKQPRTFYVKTVWQPDKYPVQRTSAILIPGSCSQTDQFSILDTGSPERTILLRFLVSRDGKPFGIKMERESRDATKNQEAVDFVKTCSFVPAKRDGKAEFGAAAMLLSGPEILGVLTSKEEMHASFPVKHQSASNALNTKLKRTLITPSTHDVGQAMYYKHVQKRIEEVGTMFFPEHDGKKLYGDAIVYIPIFQDGTIYIKEGGARLERSSNDPELDRAILRTVYRSAPFQQIPMQLRSPDQDEVWEVLARFSFEHVHGSK